MKQVGRDSQATEQLIFGGYGPCPGEGQSVPDVRGHFLSCQQYLVFLLRFPFQ